MRTRCTDLECSCHSHGGFLTKMGLASVASVPGAAEVHRTVSPGRRLYVEGVDGGMSSSYIDSIGSVSAFERRGEMLEFDRSKDRDIKETGPIRPAPVPSEVA